MRDQRTRLGGLTGRLPQPFRSIVLLAIVTGAVLMMAESPATAQEDGEGFGIVGTLTYEGEEGEDVPVPGVEITAAGAETVTTDDDGAFRIEVPEPGPYEVTLDVETLPEEIRLRDADRSTVEARVSADRDQRVIFPLEFGEGGGGAGSDRFRRFAQLTAEGLKQGLYLAMAAIGLSLIFGTTGLVNFAHAELVTWGMLSTYFFNVWGFAGLLGFLAPLPGPFGDGVNLVWAAVLGMITGGVLGYFLNRFIFRGARRAGVSLIAQMLMTIGLSILMRYLFLYYFRGRPRTFTDYSAQRAIDFGPVELTRKDIAAMTLSIIVLLGVGLYLQRTRMGKAMRAVSDNRDLAESTGINVELVISTVWAAGAALAALGGVFFGLDVVKWDFGFRTLLLIFAAVVLGGLGSAYGALVGSLIVGLSINLSTLWFDPELKNMIALGVMVVILLVRPQGIFGRAERIG